MRPVWADAAVADSATKAPTRRATTPQDRFGLQHGPHVADVMESSALRWDGAPAIELRSELRRRTRIRPVGACLEIVADSDNDGEAAGSRRSRSEGRTGALAQHLRLISPTRPVKNVREPGSKR